MTIQAANALVIAAVFGLAGCGETGDGPRSEPLAGAMSEPEFRAQEGVPITPAARVHRAGVNNLYEAQRFCFAGQPDEPTLVWLLEDRGVRTVINIRVPGEMTGMGMDARGLAEEYGARYESIPVSVSTFSRADIDRFAEIISASEGRVLVHCASSNRVGGLWAAYLATHHDVPIEDAIEIGRSAGLSRASMADAARRVAAESAASEEGG